MNYRIIIHALILLFILHIIIINTHYTVSIGPKIESFRNKEENKIEKMDNEKTLDFLNSNKKDDEFIQRMNMFSQENNKAPEDAFEKKNEFPVIPANGVLSNENVPNFESNVADTPKFYNINTDTSNQNEMKATSIQDLNKTATTILKEDTPIDNQVRQSTEKPTSWEYNDEFAMNGGKMGGIVGFDGLESQFADFGSLLHTKDNSNQKNEDNIPHDDLRKPVVYNA